MRYGELVQLYFDRGAALQWYWTLYVVIIGGLLAFSSLRQRRDLVTATLVTVLFLCFAYKNLGAIGDTIHEREAILQSIRVVNLNPEDGSAALALRNRLEPILQPVDFPGARRFHLCTDVLTVAALWGMERRRRKMAEEKATVI